MTGPAQSLPATAASMIVTVIVPFAAVGIAVVVARFRSRRWRLR